MPSTPASVNLSRYLPFISVQADPDAPGGRVEAALGERVRELRQARGWSQDHLARRMRSIGFNWMQSTVAKTEAAERPIRVGEAASLATVFEVDIADLFRSGIHPLVQRMQLLASELHVANQDYRAQKYVLEEAERVVDSVKDRLGALQVLSRYLSGGETSFRDAIHKVATAFHENEEWKTILVECGFDREILDTADEKAAEEAENRAHAATQTRQWPPRGCDLVAEFIPESLGPQLLTGDRH